MHKQTDSKDDLGLILEQIKALIENEPDFLANMANISSVIYHGLSDINWSGFYLISNETLILGPFQGLPACTRIPLTKGVCGKAARTLEIQNIRDVHQFEGHIACDSASNSELVIPMVKDGKLIGVLDLDSIRFERFSLEIQIAMTNAVALLLEK